MVLASPYDFLSILRQILDGKFLHDGGEIFDAAWYMCGNEMAKRLERAYFVMTAGDTCVAYGNGRIDFRKLPILMYWASESGQEPMSSLKDGVTTFKFDGNGVLIDPTEKIIYIAFKHSLHQFENLNDRLRGMAHRLSLAG